MNIIKLLGAVAGMLAFSAAASASVVYTNDAPGESSAYTVNNSFSVSDSFTLTSGTTLASATIALAGLSGNSASSLTWAIGSQAFGTDYGTGNSNVANNPYQSGWGDSKFATFGLNAILNSGTYWLTVSNAQPDLNPIYWITTANNTPSAYQEGPGYSAYPIGQGVYFSLSDAAGTVPEPATLSIIGLGLAGIGAVRRRRK